MSNPLPLISLVIQTALNVVPWLFFAKTRGRNRIPFLVIGILEAIVLAVTIYRDASGGLL